MIQRWYYTNVHILWISLQYCPEMTMKGVFIFLISGTWNICVFYLWGSDLSDFLFTHYSFCVWINLHFMSYQLNCKRELNKLSKLKKKKEYCNFVFLINQSIFYHFFRSWVADHNRNCFVHWNFLYFLQASKGSQAIQETQSFQDTIDWASYQRDMTVI